MWLLLLSALCHFRSKESYSSAQHSGTSCRCDYCWPLLTTFHFGLPTVNGYGSSSCYGGTDDSFLPDWAVHSSSLVGFGNTRGSPFHLKKDIMIMTCCWHVEVLWSSLGQTLQNRLESTDVVLPKTSSSDSSAAKKSLTGIAVALNILIFAKGKAVWWRISTGGHGRSTLITGRARDSRLGLFLYVVRGVSVLTVSGRSIFGVST